MSRYVDRVRILVAYVVARGGLRHAARVVCPVWLAVFTLLTGTATSFQATAQDFASCPAPQKLIWGGGGTDIRTDGPVSSDCWSRDQHPNYIWGPPILYPSPGPWAARVSGECTGSGYHVVLWSGVRACFGGEACMDASIDGQLPNPDSTTAQLLPGCVNTSSDNTCPVGKPVQPGSGAKVFVETDYRSASGSLTLTRYYNSQAPQASITLTPGLLGDYWRTEYDRQVYALAGSNYAAAFAVRPNARIKYFDAAGNEISHFQGTAAETLVATPTGWTYTTGTDEVETYDTNGRLIGLWDKFNFQRTLSYDSQGRLSQVMDASGRSLTFSYTGSISSYAGGSVAITTPDGSQFAYTVGGKGNESLLSVSSPGSTTRQYVYEKGGYPTAVTGIIDESNVRYETVDYDDSGRAIDSYLAPSLNNGTIDRHAFAFNNDGTVTETDPLGATATLQFVTIKGVLNLQSASQPCDACGRTIKTRTYDGAGYLQQTVDFNGAATSYIYDDSRGLEMQRTEASGTSAQRTTTTAWNATFRVPEQRTVVNTNGVTESITTWTYNGRGQATARCQIDPNVSGATSYTCGFSTNAPTGVRQWKYAYCDAVGTGCPLVGLLKSADGPRTDVADVTTYAYYASTDLSGCATLGGTCHNLGDLQSVTNALGQTTTTVSYDKNGRVTRTQDANGVLTDMTYHPRGWLLTRTVRANANGAPSALDATTTFAYDSVGNVMRVTQPDGTYLHYVYDAAHRMTDIYDSATPVNYLQGNHIHYTLDAAGNRIDEQTKDTSGALKRELSRSYDQLNRLTALLNSSHVAVQTYTNPADAPPSGSTYTDGYDGNGNAIYSIDGTGVHVGTEQQYDPLNRLVKTLQDHAGTGATRDTTTQYAYDTRDNLRSVIDPDGLVTGYTYDGLNNLTDLTGPDTGHAGYTYDAAGNRTKQMDARGITSTYSYDALNRLAGISYPTTSLNITYTYDQAASGCYNVGRLTKITDSSGSTTYCYDLRGNVLKKAQVTGTTTLTTVYSYSLADRLASVTYPSHLVATYTRDSVGRVGSMAYTTSAGVTSPLITSLRYLPFGPLTGITFKNGRTLTKTYDSDYAIDKVVSSAATGLIVDATVDVLGNLASAGKTMGATPPTQQYLYDPLYRLTTIENGTGTSLLAFTYDLTGDRLSKTPQGQSKQASTYTPNTHHLASVASVARQYDAAGNTVNIGTTKFTYDDRNRRITAGTTTYNYNGRGERVSKGTTRFVYAEAGQLLGEYTSTGVVQKEYLWLEGIPVAMVASGTLYYIETDQLGTPRQVIKPATTTASDITVWKWDYFANNAAFGENTPAVQTVTFNLRFPGQYYDSETGLSYNYFRDYEPATGRYVESDPIGLDGGISTYAYVTSSPLRGSDFFGLAGCGTGWNEPLVPDNPFRFKFSSCCDSHDECYDCAGVEAGMDKKDCDLAFRKCMYRKCSHYSFPVRFVCHRTAALYARAVQQFGQGAYTNGTKNCLTCTGRPAPFSEDRPPWIPSYGDW